MLPNSIQGAHVLIATIGSLAGVFALVLAFMLSGGDERATNEELVDYYTTRDNLISAFTVTLSHGPVSSCYLSTLQ
jgi:hypothetical protein